MSKRLIIVGAGDLAKELLGWMHLSDSLSSHGNLCFIDDKVSLKICFAIESLKICSVLSLKTDIPDYVNTD